MGPAAARLGSSETLLGNAYRARVRFCACSDAGTLSVPCPSRSSCLPPLRASPLPRTLSGLCWEPARALWRHGGRSAD